MLPHKSFSQATNFSVSNIYPVQLHVIKVNTFFFLLQGNKTDDRIFTGRPLKSHSSPEQNVSGGGSSALVDDGEGVH